MCGIAGKINFNKKPVDNLLIKKMCDAIVHRGPDDEGIYCSEYIGMGQRRLSIIDLRRQATPPLTNEDGTIFIVFNGEIYNFLELRKELIGKGHIFYTLSDTEVIIHLYEEYGTSCLKHLSGMFAFAIWDDNQKVLFAARDRLGKKPFFYAHTGSSLTFGSEIKAITADPTVKRSPNYAAIDAYLRYQYVPSPYTSFSGINKLPAANYLLCDTKGIIKIEKYWEQQNIEKMNIMEKDAEIQLFKLLQESVRLRMVSDVPIGAFLSGGIDSGIIVALMAMESWKPVKTFTIGFDENDYDELPYAKLVAERYHTEHHEFIVRPDAANVLPLLVRHYNEPFADSSALPTFYLSRLTRQHVTVALSGDGGDENFGGYQRYRKLAIFNLMNNFPAKLRSILFDSIDRKINCVSTLSFMGKVIRFIHMLKSEWPERYRIYMNMFKDQERSYLYTPEFMQIVSTEQSVNDPWCLPWENRDNHYEWMMKHDRSNYLPDCLMVKTDVASMANGLEVRCPFLDNRVTEFATMLPTEYKINKFRGKIILKRIANNLLPKAILNKKKTGFAIPLDSWFRNELAGYLQSILLDDISLNRGIFSKEALRRMLQEQISGKRNWSNRLWALLMLELWFREFID